MLVVTAVSLAPNRVSVAVKDQGMWIDCTQDPAPRDHITQAAHKKHFKLKKVRSISAQTGTEGPAPHAMWSPQVGSGTDSQKGT